MDLEELIKESVDWSDYSFPGAPENMGTLCSDNDRDTVLQIWAESFDEATERIRTAPEDKTVVLACHLTLFSPSRLEFYSPPLLASLMKAELRVDRVIVLIDDIYDMYGRLSRNSGLLSEVVREHAIHASSLTGPVDPLDVQPEDFSGTELELLSREAQAQALLQLLYWRRSEMIAAEDLAHNLTLLSESRVPLSVVAVKHDVESLRKLVTDSSALTVYISHKITEARVANLKAEEGTWVPLVAEVNKLGARLRENGIVGIQPTAIDELRFRRNRQEAARLARRSLDLADRWPLPNTVIQDPAQAASLLGTPSDLAHNDFARGYASGLAGILQHSIFDEIAFRDHLLVNCNDGILAYRPGAIEPRISGGVRNEVSHWAGSTNGPRGFRPLVLIHLADDIDALLDAFPAKGRPHAALVGFSRALSRFPRQQISEWWEQIRTGSTIEELVTPKPEHLYRSVPRDLRVALTSAVQSAVVELLGASCAIDATYSHYAAHFVADDAETLDSEAFFEKVANYVKKPTPTARLEANHASVEAVKKRRSCAGLEDLIRDLVS